MRYTYEPFGGLIYQTQTSPNRMKFAGEQSPDPPSPHRGDPGGHDDLENYYYLRARYYDPAIGRFISRDPLGGGARSPYAYAGNNPVNRVDPSGLLEIGACDGGLCLFDPDGNIVNTIGPGMTFYVGGDGQNPSFYVVMNGEGQGRALGFEGNHSVGGWIDVGDLGSPGWFVDPSTGDLFTHNSPWGKIAKAAAEAACAAIGPSCIATMIAIDPQKIIGGIHQGANWFPCGAAAGALIGNTFLNDGYTLGGVIGGAAGFAAGFAAGYTDTGVPDCPFAP